MNRGSVTSSPPGESLCSRFNEAPIHESGKYGRERSIRIAKELLQ